MTSDLRADIRRMLEGHNTLTLATVGLVIFSSPRPTETERVGFACAPTLTDPGVSCRMSF